MAGCCHVGAGFLFDGPNGMCENVGDKASAREAAMIGPFNTEWQAGTALDSLTADQIRSMRWGVKTVRADFTARNGYRWPFPGGWAVEETDIDWHNKGPCPSMPGDGLSVGLTFAGMAQGGRPARTVLIVGWLPGDLLGEDCEKVRVRCGLVAAVVDGEGSVRKFGRGAYLDGADLRGAYLGGADLGWADLGWADLRGAYLDGADLRGAYLGGADLCGAHLGGADLCGAHLGGTYLGGADLCGAHLGGADLDGAYADKGTVWPCGYDPEAAGVSIRK